MFIITRQANLLRITATTKHNNNNRPLVRRDKFIYCNGNRTRIFGRPARRIDTTPTLLHSPRNRSVIMWAFNHWQRNASIATELSWQQSPSNAISCDEQKTAETFL